MIYKVLKPELFIAETKLLGKYDLWENNALNPIHICHSKTFGTKEDFEYMSFNSIWSGFNIENHEIRIECSSYGGMCGFDFDRESLNAPNLSKIDKDCIEYTFKFIDDLKENGIIGEGIYMKINELKRIAEENDYEYEMRHFQYKLKKMQGTNCITISNDVEKTLWISNKSHCDKKDFNMIKAAVEFAETPIDERKEEEKYFYEHRFIKTRGGNPTYLAIRQRPNTRYPILQGSCKNIFEYKVEFTDKEMEEAKKQYGIFLDDFVKKSIIEVLE